MRFFTEPGYPLRIVRTTDVRIPTKLSFPVRRLREHVQSKDFAKLQGVVTDLELLGDIVEHRAIKVD
jgi:hypothetical protein